MPNPHYMFAGVHGMNSVLGSRGMVPDGLILSPPASTGPKPQPKLGNGAFPHIDRRDFETTRDERIVDPGVMNQSTGSLCGPACFLNILARNRPGDYHNFVTALYDSGEGHVGTFRVKPGHDCRNITLKHLKAADWVGMASIRDSENAFFDYDDEDDAVAGITLPHELSGWFKKAGFTVEAEEANVVLSRGESYLRRADALRKQGCEICLFINADMLTAGKLTPRSHPFYIPNHWVVLTSDVTFAPGKVSFEVFTWGQGDYPVPMSPPCVPKAIYDNFFGFLAIRP